MKKIILLLLLLASWAIAQTVSNLNTLNVTGVASVAQLQPASAASQVTFGEIWYDTVLSRPTDTWTFTNNTAGLVVVGYVGINTDIDDGNGASVTIGGDAMTEIGWWTNGSFIVRLWYKSAVSTGNKSIVMTSVSGVGLGRTQFAFSTTASSIGGVTTNLPPSNSTARSATISLPSNGMLVDVCGGGSLNATTTPGTDQIERLDVDNSSTDCFVSTKITAANTAATLANSVLNPYVAFQLNP